MTDGPRELPSAEGRESGGDGGRERPPFGGRWGTLYALVVAALAIEIALLAWLTERFR